MSNFFAKDGGLILKALLLSKYSENCICIRGVSLYELNQLSYNLLSTNDVIEQLNV